MRRAPLLLAVALAAAPASTLAAGPSTPLTHDPLGPLVDVTASWQRFQPAAEFCVPIDTVEFASGTGATATGADPACAFSGFAPTDTGLYRVKISTPPLCPGCRRLFLDFSRIPAANAPPLFYAHGHAYLRLQSPNWTYTVDPKAHSPNTKNFTNDKAFVPDGSGQEPWVSGFDTHAMSYVTDTAHFVHSQIQGPYYIGPWYVSTRGRRVAGVTLDVDVMSATSMGRALDEIGYAAGYSDGETCFDHLVFDGMYRDADFGYAGCVNRFGFSGRGVNPYAS